MSRIGAIVLLSAVAALTACAGPTSATQPTTLTNPPAPTIAIPTQTPRATVTSQPSPTLVTESTSTPTPHLRLSATSAVKVSATPTPEGWNPLTGEIAADPALLAHRPLAVKVVNEPACARPQYGLQQAAVVFEHYVEAWGTRFTAIFYGYEADRIGAIRSARMIDLELPAIFDAALVTSGSSGGVRQRLEASDFSNRVISFQWQHQCPPLCLAPIESVPCADIEHTMFTTLDDLWEQSEAFGIDQPPDLSGWAFSAAPPPGGQSAATVHVGYLNSPVDWRYEPDNGLYHRWQDGVRHLDAVTHQRLTTSNVVVLFAHHLFNDIRESTNFYSLEIQFWGQGPAVVFRDGQAYPATWVRQERQGLFQLLDPQGNPLPLHPGRTYFEFVALDSTVESTTDTYTITAAVLPQLTPP